LIGGTYQNSLRGSNSTDYSVTTATSDASNLPVITGINNRTFSEEQTRVAIHSKLDYRFSKNHKLQWYNAFLDFQNQQVRDERKTNLSFGYDPAKGNYNLSYDRRFRFTHQQIINSTLKGEHNLFKNGQLLVDWSLVYSHAKNEVPENTSVHLSATVRNNIENPKSVVVLGGAERRWEHNTDEDKTAYLNLHYQIANDQLPITIAAGGMYRNKARTNYFNQYDFRPFDESKPAGQQNNLIEGTDWKKYSEISFMVYNPLGSLGDPLNYNASEEIIAGYFQGKLAAKKWEALAGLRLENTDQGYFLKNPVAGLPNEGNQVYTDLLPSLNFKYLLSNITNLRASYYRAINRPSFFEIVPYRIVNEELTEAGNPDLKHTVADNIDLRFETFPKRAEQFMVGIFYKRIMDPIEFGMVLQGQSSFYMPSNYGNATNYGLEIDYTKYLHSFGIKLNYTYTRSTITTTKLFYYRNPDPTAVNQVLLKNVDQTRSLAGQAAHVANATLLYKNMHQGIDAQLSLAYTGDRLFAISKYLDNDMWQSGFVQMDASAEKKIGKGFVVFLKVSNLLNTPVKLYVKKENAANNNTPGYTSIRNGTMTRIDEYGLTLLAGLRVKF
jgi:TonB-dependent receptor